MTEPLFLRPSIAALVMATVTTLAACGGSDSGGNAGAEQASSGSPATAQSEAASPTPESGRPVAEVSAPANTRWSFCASEKGLCSFTGTRHVRYGSKGLYKYATYTDGVACSNGVFGDPVPGTLKACSVSVTQTATADTPQPAPPTKPSQAGDITLAWIAPQSNADGSPITNLAGYRVRYGTRSGSYTTTVDINDPNVLNHRLTGLPASTYYLTVTAYNAANIESPASVEVSKSIR